MSHKAVLYKKLSNDTVRCTACRHYCVIPNGQTGICGIRQNKHGELHLLVYGNAVAAHIDPVEKKPLFHFLPDSEIFSIVTVGCNFACQFCQNWDISQAAQDFKKSLSREGNLDKLDVEITKFGYELPPDKIVEYCKQKKIPSIAFTYNEPSIFFEYTFDTAKIARDAGIKTVYVSNGYASTEAVDKIAPYLDAVNVDLKAFTEEFYNKTCQAKLQPVLASIKYYHQKGIWLEITTLVIPGENDSPKELQQIAEFISSKSPYIPWQVSSFSPAYKMLDKGRTPSSTLKKAYELGKKAGLKFVYVGNVQNEDLQSTYCPNCNKLLIKRDWGFTKIENLQAGRCAHCGTKIEGIWEP